MSWKNFTRDNRCPICGHDDWCAYTDDGELVCCHRMPNDRPARNGNGWIYQVGPRTGGHGGGGAPAPCAARPQDHGAGTPSSPQPKVDVALHFEALKTGSQQQRLARGLGEQLGLTPGSLLLLDIRWDSSAQSVAFPMRDAFGKVVGIRYRRVTDGTKRALKGGHDGLFYDPRTIRPNEELVICEGPTDTAAALEIGLDAVGRSCCSSGRDLILALIRRLKAPTVTIAADDDPPKRHPDGSTWRPGIEGAERLANALPVPVRIMFPPKGFKDLRAWYQSGTMTREAFDRRAAAATWRGPNKVTIIQPKLTTNH